MWKDFVGKRYTPIDLSSDLAEPHERDILDPDLKHNNETSFYCVVREPGHGLARLCVVFSVLSTQSSKVGCKPIPDTLYPAFAAAIVQV